MNSIKCRQCFFVPAGLDGGKRAVNGIFLAGLTFHAAADRWKTDGNQMVYVEKFTKF